MTDQQEITIGEFPKNATEKVIAKLQHWKDAWFYSIRVYYDSGDGWKPTKKGLTIHFRSFWDLFNLVNKSQEEIKKLEKDEK